MNDLDTLRPEVREAINRQDRQEKCDEYCPVCEDRATIRAELLRLAMIEADALIALDCEHDWQVEHERAEKAEAENARLNKVESRETERRLEMEDVELYLMDVSQPEDEGAGWLDRMKSAIEGLVQDCNEAVGQKNQAIQRAETVEAELAALKARIAEAPVAYLTSKTGVGPCNVASMAHGVVFDSSSYGKSVRVVLDE